MRTELLAAVLVALAGPASKAIAEPVVLKCRTQDGLDASDLMVDIANNKMKWGDTNYNITHVSSEYITAYEETNAVGGEVWVMHRATGDYWRALAGKFCTDKNATRKKWTSSLIGDVAAAACFNNDIMPSYHLACMALYTILQRRNERWVFILGG